MLVEAPFVFYWNKGLKSRFSPVIKQNIIWLPCGGGGPWVSETLRGGWLVGPLVLGDSVAGGNVAKEN